METALFNRILNNIPDPVCLLVQITADADVGSNGYTVVGKGVSGVTRTAEGKAKVALVDSYQELLGVSYDTTRSGSKVLVENDAVTDGADPHVDVIFEEETAPTVSAPISSLVGDSGDVDDGTTPSAQLTGTGNTTLTADIGAYRAEIWEGSDRRRDNGSAITDHDVHSGSYLTGFAVGESVIASFVAEVSAGVWSVQSVLGAVATDGSEVEPTDAEITAAIGHANWIKLGNNKYNRDGDTSVTVTADDEAKELAKVSATATTAAKTNTDPDSATINLRIWLRTVAE